MHMARAAAARRVARDGHHIALALAGIGQRVAAAQAFGQMQVDMRARCHRLREFGGRWQRAQLDADDALGFVAQLVDQGVQGIRGHGVT
ncbi:hypothetical protein D3C71_1832710 [compost metagenome]